MNRFGGQLKIENMSYSIESHNGYELASGFKTSLAMERHFKSSLPRPYSNCDLYGQRPKLDNYELYDAIMHSGYDYEQQLCISNSSFELKIFNILFWMY